MTDWNDDLTRVAEIQEMIESNTDSTFCFVSELLELANNEEWSVQRYAVNALGTGLIDCPEAGVTQLDALIKTVLDETVPSPDRWREGIISVASTAPKAMCNAVFAGFEEIPPERRDDAGEGCAAKCLERVAVNNSALLADSLDRVRAICRTSALRARQHLFGVHLVLVSTHPERVRPALPMLLDEFESGTGDTRRVASDILCGLSIYSERRSEVGATIIRWLENNPQNPCEQQRSLNNRESILCPSLTDTPHSGSIGVTQVLARIAEERPEAVAPHYSKITNLLATGDTTSGDQWARSHLTRALAAIARQQPEALDSSVDNVVLLLTDESEFVRFWATHGLLALYPHQPDAIFPTLIGEVLTDKNTDICERGVDLAEYCVRDGVVDADELVSELQYILSEASDRQSRRVLSAFASIAHHDPRAVRPALPTIVEFLTDPQTANDAVTIYKEAALADPEAVQDAIPTLVDCLFTTSLTVRDIAAEALTELSVTHPSLLDDQLDILTTIIEREHPGIDAIAKVVGPLGDRSLNTNQTVFDFVHTKSSAGTPAVRRRATRLLGAFVEASTNTKQAVSALTDRLDDSEDKVQETALEVLATYVADSGDGALVRSLYETGTNQWRALTADLLSQATLYDSTWTSDDFQQWLANQLQETVGETRKSLVEATGHICGQTTSVNGLVTALLECLTDPEIAKLGFRTVRNIVTHGETTVPTEELAKPVEETILDPMVETPSACFGLIPNVATDLDAPQRVTDRLLDQVRSDEYDIGQVSTSLVSLCARDVTIPGEEIVIAYKQYVTNEPVSPRDWACQNIGRVLREINSGLHFRDTFVPLATDGPSEQRASAYCAFASVAAEWPEAVKPVVDTLRAGVHDNNTRISNAAFSALVAVGRKFPEVLRSVAGQVTEYDTSRGIIRKRREYEAISLLAADGFKFDVTVVQALRAGLLNDDKLVKEYALKATGKLSDRRLIPHLHRLDTELPDWSSLPAYFTTSETVSQPIFDSLPKEQEQAVTASDVMSQFE